MKKYDRLTEDQFEEVIAYYATHSKVDTASHFNVSECSLGRYLTRHGYKKHAKTTPEAKLATYSKEELYKKRNEKTRTTMTERYGSWSNAAKISHAKVSQTKLERYGDANYNNRKKYKETCIEIYGCENSFMAEEIKKNFNTDEIIAKANESRHKTFLEKYGVDCIGQLNQSHIGHRYKYNDEFFDSSWELALYIYTIDHNEEIVRQPCALAYIFEDNQYNYYPDFKYKGELIELKGTQFLGENAFINQYRPEANEKEKAKYDCAIANNVKIWSKDEIKFAVDYCIKKYKDRLFYNQFKQEN